MRRCGIISGAHRAKIGLLAALLLVLCGVFTAPSRAEVKIEKVSYKGWDGAYRLSNGTVEVVVVPGVARIMRYGFIGGPNLLWENAKEVGKPARIGQWPNFGGDKAWPWPQDDWPARAGSAWPPPAASDQTPHAAKTVGRDTLRLTSPLIVGYGVRIVRDITLSERGAQVRITTRFEKQREGADFPVGVWTITQIPVPETLLARLIPGAEKALPENYKMLMPTPWKSLRTEKGILYADRSRTESGKIGTDADLLAAVLGDTLFTIRALTTSLPLSAFVPGERAQFYSNPDPAPGAPADSATPYVEMEFTSPVKTLRSGETLTLETIYQARKLMPEQRVPAAVAGLIRTM